MNELKEIMLNSENNPEQLTEEECEDMFRQLDTNRDGVLQLSEISAYIRGH